MTTSGAAAGSSEAMVAREGDAHASARWRRLSADAVGLTLVLTVSVLLWIPRLSGPIDLRWDGAVYYVLGTSLAEGRGYRLLNEPGDIEAVQYPPLLPAIVALHQLVLGTSDPTTVGGWLRLTWFLTFVGYAGVLFRFLRVWLPVGRAVLGSLLSLFCFHTWFLSDALFPEIAFGLATLLFLTLARTGSERWAAAYVAAVAAYALRTVGIVAFVAWVLESALRLRVRQALGRALLAAIPVLCWQLYVLSVERSEAYNQPAYDYQRAPYMFYNVSYGRNVALRDPFAPEKGDMILIRRVARNALLIPVHVGEALSTSRRYYETWLHWLVGGRSAIDAVITWGVFLVLSVLGGVLVVGGIVVLIRRGCTIVPSYLLVYIVALCLTPFPGQFLRYLSPVVPLLALSSIVFLDRLDAWRRHRRINVGLPTLVLGPALLIQVVTAAGVYARDHQPVAYTDARGEPATHRLFFYGDSQREFDRAIRYLRAHANPADVVAAGTPHWIHLWTGLETVMPPFEIDVEQAQKLLDSVPVRYLVIGEDVVATERYMLPVVQRFTDDWERVYSTPDGHWDVYRRVDP